MEKKYLQDLKICFYLIRFFLDSLKKKKKTLKLTSHPHSVYSLVAFIHS